MKKIFLLTALGLTAALTFSSCGSYGNANAVRYNDGIPVYNLGGGYGGSSHGPSGFC